MKINISLNNVKEMLAEVNWLLGRYYYLQKKILVVGLDVKEGSDLWWKGITNEYGKVQEVTPKMRAYLASQLFFIDPQTKFLITPERSFIRAPVEENMGYIMAKLEYYVHDTTIEKDQILEKLGVDIVELMKDYMLKLEEPENHWFTIEQKGSSSPLIDTGTMLSSLTYEVQDRS